MKCFVIMPISDTDDYPSGHFNRVYLHLLRPAIEKAGSTDPKAIAQALREVSVDGVEGTFQFDAKGEGLHTMQYGTIKNGVVAYYEK